MYNYSVLIGPGVTFDTGHSLKVTYSQQVQAIRSNNERSSYYQHVPSTRHPYGNLENSSEMSNTQHEGTYLNALATSQTHKTKLPNAPLNF